MKKAFLIARSNFRKSKGQVISIAALMLIVGMMLNLWLILQMDYKKNFARHHERLNAEHVAMCVNVGGVNEYEKLYEKLTDVIEKDARTDEYSIDDALLMPGGFLYNGGDLNTTFVILDKDTAISRPVGKIEIVEDSNETSGIYVPMIYKSEDIAIGKQMKITAGTYEFNYTVCGFTNSVMGGSHNCTLCEIILTEDKYKETKEILQKENSVFANGAVFCSIRLKDKEECESYNTMLKNAISEYSYSISNYYTMVYQSRYVSQMICAAIISAMAFLILLVALVVMASNIVNYVQENMQKLGTLKAVGYTGSQIINAFHMQFLSVSVIAAMLGAALSYFVFPAINNMMISQTGIPYEMHFLMAPFLITIGILGGAVLLTVWAAVRRVKKIEPIIALRQGVKTHSFRKNHVPLEHTRTSLNIALALKTMLSSVKNNVTICISMLVSALVLVFSAVMIENVIVDINKFITLIVGETCDSCINVNSDAEQEFLQNVNQDERVEKAYLYSSNSASYVNGAELMTTIIDNYEDVNNQDVIFEGRFPKYDNEIAIAAKYADENNIHIGDEIIVTSNGKEGKYIVSGFTQITNNLGLDCIYTREGFMRLGELSDISYYINLVDGADVDAFNSDMKDKLGNNVNMAINVDETVTAGVSVYVQLMTIIVIGVLVLSGGVVAFVLYLLVRTRLNSKKQDYGIMKSFGFTTRQLIVQTAISFMPPIILSTTVGLAVGCVVINPLMSLFLSSIGIVKCAFTVPVGLVIMEGIGIILFTFLILCLMSRKIKKLAVCSLLIGE